MTPAWIRKLRKAAKYTQEQFAAAVGVSFVTVSKWENDHSSPSPLARRRLLELAKTYRVKP